MSLHLFSGKKFRAAAALLIVVFMLMAVVPPRTANAMSLSQEKELGRKLLEVIRRAMPMVEDGEVLTYIRGVGNRVAQQVGITPYQYQFFVIDLPVPNAFAIPGGYVFIYRGLIEMMSTEGELAGIFAHELGHITAHHIERQIDESKVLSVATVAGMLAAILLGGSAGPALAAGSAAASQTAVLGYSRVHEMEADQRGFKYLCAANYDPVNMVSMMHKIGQLSWMTGVGKVPSYLSTHPDTNQRVLYLEEMVKQYKATTRKRPPRDSVGDFHLMQAALIADHADPAKALERFSAGIAKGDPVSVFGLGRFYLHQDRWADAVVQLQKAARMMQSPFILSSLGDAYYRVGKLQEAKNTLESALFLDPSASIVHYRLAVVLQDMGKRKEALDHLLQIEALAPMFPAVDYQLGVIYGQENKLGLAHYHLGRYYELKQNWRLAIMHYKKAKGYALDSPAKTDEINVALKDLEKKSKDSPIKR